MADVADGSSGFLYSFAREVKKLVKKQRKDIETTVKTDIEAVDAFLRSVGNKLSWPGPS